MTTTYLGFSEMPDQNATRVIIRFANTDPHHAFPCVSKPVVHKAMAEVRAIFRGEGAAILAETLPITEEDKRPNGTIAFGNSTSTVELSYAAPGRSNGSLMTKVDEALRAGFGGG